MTDSKSFPSTPGKKVLAHVFYKVIIVSSMLENTKKQIYESGLKIPERKIRHDLDILKKGFALW